MAGRSRRPTSADVAERAGVSRATVSMVMNGRVEGTVSEATRARVLAAAEELGYTRSAVALSLKNRRTRTLGLITDEISTSPFAGRMVRAASAEAAARGYMVITVDLSMREASLDDAIRLLAEQQVEGLIYATMGRSRACVPRIPGDMPLVMLNCAPMTTDAPRGGREQDAETVPFVEPDDHGGARRAAQRLVDVGHTAIAMLSGDAPDDVARIEREGGFREVMEAAGLDPVIIRSGWQMNDGYREAHRVLTAPTPPTALFCIRDRVAAGAMHAAAALGRSVPQDLSVIGFDDEDFFAGMLTPGLTTIALPHAEMGEWAARTVIDRIEVDGSQHAADPERAGAAAGEMVRPAEGQEPRTAGWIAACPLVERASVAQAPAVG